jgi:TM2 domain-containing membrane protein YozV
VKNKVTAAILAFFLGGFGVHRFYLGQVGKGVLYLLFCWTPIPWIIAFIDSIVFLATSEKSFNFKYNQDYIHQLYPSPQAAPTVVIHQHGYQASRQGFSQSIPPAQNQRQQEYQRRQQANQHNKTTQQQPKRAARPKIDPFQKSGNEKYSEYDFDGAIRDYLRSLNVRAHNPKVHFNLACLYSVMEQTDSAFFHLEKAVAQGYYNFDKIQTHDHLAFIRSQQPTFDNFVANGYKTGVAKKESEEKLALDEDLITQLERLAKMQEAGLLTEEEFQSQKVKILQ